MENCTGVSTNNTCVTVQESTVLSEPGFAAFYIAIILIQLLGLALIVLLIGSLCCNSSLHKPLTVFLVNQLAACIIFIIHNSSIHVMALVLALSDDLPSPPLSFCQFLIWGYGLGSVGRMWSLTAFSIVVFVTIKRGVTSFRPIHYVTGVLGVWMVTFVIIIYITLPYPVYAAEYVDNVICFPHHDIIPPTSRIPTLAIWVVAGGIIPLTISITIPVITLCYIKRNIITEGAEYNKGMAKFTLFLVTGNIVNLLGQLTPGLVALYVEVPGVVIAYLLIVLSTLPTPVSIIVILKPVRERMKKIMCFLCTYKGSLPKRNVALPTARTAATLSQDLVTEHI
jgi:hypothetical protein